MINLRFAPPTGLPVIMTPPFGSRPNIASPRSISLTSRESITLSSIPENEAADWIAANCPMLD